MLDMIELRGGGGENSSIKGKKVGFTLSEVLITIGIIGVVAAMTLPSLINNSKNRELQTQLKKTYSELNQMSQLFYNDYGMSVPEYTSQSNNAFNDFINNKFPKYFKLTNKIDDWRHDDVDEDTGSAIDTMPYKLHALGSSDNVGAMCDVSGYYADVIGRYYLFNDRPGAANENGPVICVDINGPKRPNMYGKDYFLFVFTTDGYVIPMGQTHRHNKILYQALIYNGVNVGEDFCRLGSGTSAHVRNTTCAYYAISDVNPQGNGTYWKDFLKGK